MERRSFIKLSCVAGVATLLPDVLMIGLSGCKTTGIYHATIVDHRLTIPVEMFKETSLQIVRAKELENDIALRKETDGSYTALEMSCTHADNPLVSTGNGFICNLHGSTFDMQGGVTKGPAAKALTKFAAERVNENVVITMN